MLQADPKYNEYETQASTLCTELRLRRVQNVITRKVAIVIGFSEVAHAAERTERIERFLYEHMEFAKRDIHVYSDLSRKNICRVMDDLAPVLQPPSDNATFNIHHKVLVFVYFAARWDEPHGDMIVNDHLGERTNIAAKLISLIENPQHNCNVIVLRESELRLPSSYQGKDYSDDPAKTRPSAKYMRIQASISKFIELTHEAIEKRKVLLLPQAFQHAGFITQSKA